MMTHSLAAVKDLIHAQLCYQLFITPLHLPLEKKYRPFARMACELLERKRSGVIHKESPRHHVIHRFAQKNNPEAPKILVTHGWMSRAAYMVRIIRFLHNAGYDVYALDFPAHGDSKGFQLSWLDAVAIIREILNAHGPFYATVGHSFGGSMLLNALNLSGQLAEWNLISPPQKVVLIASPTQMRSPVSGLARRFRLNGQGYLYLRHLFRQQNEVDPALVRLSHFLAQSPSTPFLCIHGEEDKSINPKESITFCNEYQNAELALLPNADHVSVLMDERVVHKMSSFLK
jgi:pimeloyl-ACP methyl ester carboxylesterase